MKLYRYKAEDDELMEIRARELLSYYRFLGRRIRSSYGLAFGLLTQCR